MRGDEIIAETNEPIVWVESEKAWHVTGSYKPWTYFCDYEKQMTVVEIV